MLAAPRGESRGRVPEVASVFCKKAQIDQHCTEENQLLSIEILTDQAVGVVHP